MPGCALAAEQNLLSCVCSQLCPQCHADTFIMLVNWISKMEGKQVVLWSSQFNLIYWLISQRFTLAQDRSIADTGAGSWAGELTGMLQTDKQLEVIHEIITWWAVSFRFLFWWGGEGRRRVECFQAWQILPSLLQGNQWKKLTQVLRPEEYALPVKGRNNTINYSSALEKAILIIMSVAYRV